MGALAAIAAAVEDALKTLRVQSNEPPLTPTRSGEFREAGRMRSAGPAGWVAGMWSTKNRAP